MRACGFGKEARPREGAGMREGPPFSRGAGQAQPWDNAPQCTPTTVLRRRATVVRSYDNEQLLRVGRRLLFKSPNANLSLQQNSNFVQDAFFGMALVPANGRLGLLRAPHKATVDHPQPLSPPGSAAPSKVTTARGAPTTRALTSEVTRSRSARGERLRSRE